MVKGARLRRALSFKKKVLHPKGRNLAMRVPIPIMWSVLRVGRFKET